MKSGVDGFRFVPDPGASAAEAKTLLAAANRVLRGEVAARARQLAAAPDAEFALAPDGGVTWRGGAVGRLIAGDSVLAPKVEALPGDFLEGELREGVRRRLTGFLRDVLRRGLAPLFRAGEAELAGAARGLVFQLGEALGSLPAAAVAKQRAALTAADRTALARLGVRLGVEAVYLDAVLKPRAAGLRALLWAVWHGVDVPGVPNVAAPRDPAVPDQAYEAAGWRVLGPRVLRVDRVERLAAALRRLARQAPFAPTPALAALAGCSLDELVSVVPALGYRAVLRDDGNLAFHPPHRRGDEQRAGKPWRHKRRVAAEDPAKTDGPFAKLKELRLAR